LGDFSGNLGPELPRLPDKKRVFCGNGNQSQPPLSKFKKIDIFGRMVTEITQGIKVSVETEYQPSYSSPSQYHYVFTYRITIENQSEYTIQLLRRHWLISDAGFARREVEGDGVVGQQPVLEPGQAHQYVSGCNLKSGIGKMVGTYLMERIVDGIKLKVNIPEFTMVAPLRLN
jgi:ApaG protein